MKTVDFVTTNPNKLREANEIGVEYDIRFNQIQEDYPELRSEDVTEVAIRKAEDAFKIVGKPIIVEDSGIFIDALSGFPGTISAYAFKTLGMKGLLKLLEQSDDRKASMRTVIAYCDGENTKTFLGETKGRIAEEVKKASGGFGYDPFFIPEDQNQTFAENPEYKKIVSHRTRAFRKFCEWYQKL
jgi:XTP/dITP diphosphohydrolase